MEALLPTAIYRCFLPPTLLQPRPFVRVSLRVEHSAVHRVPLLIGKSLRAELALDEFHLKRTCRVSGALHEFYATAKYGLARGDHQATDSSANMLSLRLQSFFRQRRQHAQREAAVGKALRKRCLGGGTLMCCKGAPGADKKESEDEFEKEDKEEEGEAGGGGVSGVPRNEGEESGGGVEEGGKAVLVSLELILKRRRGGRGGGERGGGSRTEGGGGRKRKRNVRL